MTLHNTGFSGNQGTYDGGAVYNEGTATVTGATFTGNTAEDGGGWFNEDILTATGASFSSNHAQEGAGLYNEYEATVGGIGFQYNIASESGGGLYEDGMFAHLSDSKVFSNHAPSGGGGGIYDNDTVTDTVTLANTPVTINTVNNCSPAASVPGCTG